MTVIHTTQFIIDKFKIKTRDRKGGKEAKRKQKKHTHAHKTKTQRFNENIQLKETNGIYIQFSVQEAAEK